MAKNPNQKLKLLYLMKILLENTDEDHGMTMPAYLPSAKACMTISRRCGSMGLI